MTTLTPMRPLVLTPTGDATPVEKAVADGIADGFDPETFLWLNFRRPDGGSRIWYAWTTGGQSLGDRIDQLAMAAGCDAADWLHIADRHEQTTARGRVDIKAYALRPVLAGVQTGVRSPEERREGVSYLGFRGLLCRSARVGNCHAGKASSGPPDGRKAKPASGRPFLRQHVFTAGCRQPSH
ncbi:hypothetical protein [Streptomyces sp. NPDC056672]|uniref:hypothetical protein n=1 Tax=Streptomyces sp. NPDC056672 TaxID=3345906 RepID=UPI00369CC407